MQQSGDYTLETIINLLITRSEIAANATSLATPNRPVDQIAVSMEDIKPSRTATPRFRKSTPQTPVERFSRVNPAFEEQQADNSFKSNEYTQQDDYTTKTEYTPSPSYRRSTVSPVHSVSTQDTPSTELSTAEVTTYSVNQKNISSNDFSYITQAEVTSPIKSRLRQHTMEAVGIVKFTPSQATFDDIKSEAVNFWDEGFDLKMDTDTKAKKKADWLPQDAFFSKKKAAPSSSSTSNPKWQEEATQLWQKSLQVDNSSTQESSVKGNHSYAEAVDRKTPAWAIEDTKPIIQDNSYYHQQAQVQQQQQKHWQMSPHHTTPLMMVPSQYIHMPGSIHPPPSKYDKDLLRFLYKVDQNHQTTNFKAEFQKRLISALQRHLPEIQPRTFAMLIKVLVTMLRENQDQEKLILAQHISKSWSYFLYSLTLHITTYATLPEDLLSLLELCSCLYGLFPKIQKELPIPALVHLYEECKDLCTSDVDRHCAHYLRELKAIPEDKDADMRHFDERVLSIPTAELVVSEAIQGSNVLLDYEQKREVVIANKVHNPWPRLDLNNYLLEHFLMLREEFTRPIQNAIRGLFQIEGGIPAGCAVFENVTPKSTTLLLNSSDPGVIFELDSLPDGTDLVQSFSEGTLVILLNETAVPSEHNSPDVAKTALMGVSVSCTSTYRTKSTTKVVSIHIDRNDVYRLDWSATYTIITCNSTNGATMLSTIQWLHKQCMELKRESFSDVLTPRLLAANNILSLSQVKSWSTENMENSLATNQDPIPDYLADVEIDISCVMAVRGGNFKAKPGIDLWPKHASQWEHVAMSKRPPLYSLSSSQMAALRYALRHRITVISGAPGTGKTFIAGKLVHLMTEALDAGQFHQPVLLLAKSQSTLDSILKTLVGAMSDVVRFGPPQWDGLMLGKQATRLSTFEISDNNHRQQQNLERQITKNHAKLNALMFARFQADNHCPALLSTAIAPMYLKYLQEGYRASTGDTYLPYNLGVWNVWAGNDEKTVQFPQVLKQNETFHGARWNLESKYLKRAGTGLMPMVEPHLLQTRFTWAAKNTVPILPITECQFWPFQSSTRTGTSLRTALQDIWRRIPAEQVWNIDVEERTGIIAGLAKVLVQYLDFEIEQVLKEQVKVAKAFDDNIVQKWTFISRFNRVIGMTSDFAAANREWVSTLWPRAVIVDEASEILESTLSSVLLGPRTEHIVLLGTNDVKSKPQLSNPDMSAHPRNLDVSLFERWKGSGDRSMLLEEQWRMHSEVADVVDKFNSTKDDQSSLLVTAPLATCSENMVDGSNVQAGKLYGITQRAYYVDYQAFESSTLNEKYSKLLKFELTEAEVDEARYIAFFALYLSQQPYQSPQITILTVCHLQKQLIRTIIRDEVPKRTCFTGNVGKIAMDTIEQHIGRQGGFTIISTATPANTYSDHDNVSFALTRAKYGVFIIGKPEQDCVHPRWKTFAQHMKEREQFGPHLQLTCFTHGDTFSVGHWEDFNAIRNGGCSAPCLQLMADGHACQETCHFRNHDEVVCQEPCNRIRPTICKHICTRKCFECRKNGACPPCIEETTVKLKCGHLYVGVCHQVQDIDSIECQEPVSIALDCGHQIDTECRKSYNKRLKCNVMTEYQLTCGHTATTQCGIGPVCTKICDKKLECGHPCEEMCGVFHSHDRSKCEAACPKQLICGHNCANGCANPDKHTERCMEKCNYVCSHEYKCSRECYKDCIKCVSDCPYRCIHLKCGKKCHEVCDRLPCNEPCKLKLPCSHVCSGLCGEPCPPCSTCFGSLTCSISLCQLSELGPKDKVYMLPECNCVFLVESLDQYFKNQAKNGEHTAVKLWGCPKCQKTIYRAFRYNQYIKTEITLVNTIKMQLEKERQKLTLDEKNDIINAMNDETRHGIHNMVGGRWFVCQNQHPYFIGDCGGATEISKCPECDTPIGGTQHKVVESNRFFGEFDGSNEPAWPGQK